MHVSGRGPAVTHDDAALEEAFAAGAVRYDEFASVWVVVELVFSSRTLAKIQTAPLPVVRGVNPWWNHGWVVMQDHTAGGAGAGAGAGGGAGAGAAAALLAMARGGLRLAICDLPVSTRLCFTVMGAAKDGTERVLGGTSCTVFDYTYRLRTSRHRLHLRPSQAAPRTTMCTQPARMDSPALCVEFDAFPVDVVHFLPPPEARLAN